jgi:hypothetical protein
LQADVCLNLFSLFECVCIHCFDCSLVTTFTNETQILSPVTCMMSLKNSLPYLWYCYKKWKPKPFSAFCMHPWAFLEPITRKTWDDNLA